MRKPLINILIRTSYRPKSYVRMIESINNQTYKNINLIVSYDDDRAKDYIDKEALKTKFPIGIIKVLKDLTKSFFYDNYVNELKNLVKTGYFFVLDDSDILSSTNALESLVRELNDSDGVLCQMSRNGRLKPRNDLMQTKRIIKGKVGMPCLVLKSEHKNLAYLDGSIGAADYYWIKEVSEKVKLKFCKIVLVECGERDNGKMED